MQIVLRPVTTAGRYVVPPVSGHLRRVRLVFPPRLIADESGLGPIMVGTGVEADDTRPLPKAGAAPIRSMCGRAAHRRARYPPSQGSDYLRVSRRSTGLPVILRHAPRRARYANRMVRRTAVVAGDTCSARASCERHIEARFRGSESGSQTRAAQTIFHHMVVTPHTIGRRSRELYARSTKDSARSRNRQALACEKYVLRYNSGIRLLTSCPLV